MLPRVHRLHRSADFDFVVRTGQRVRCPTVVVQVARNGAETPRFGFIVSKAVGNAPIRNLVKRRLRAASMEVVEEAYPGAMVVVRALPAAATVDFTTLARDLRSGVVRAVAKLDRLE